MKHLTTALVTGGGRGIGRAIALRLAGDGMRVAITARSVDQLAKTEAAGGGAIVSVPSDMAEPNSIRTMIEAVERRIGTIDLLVNNAGEGGPFEPVWESDPEQWWRCLEVNLRGPYECSRAVLPGMIERRMGCIVSIASGAGCQAYANMSAYVASKTALIRLSEQLALEAKPYGVTAFAVRPGIVRTALLAGALSKLPFLQQQLDMGLESPPATAADLVAFLASGKADRLSGHVFSVDDDPEQILLRADDIERGDLYMLRSRTL
jgi:NAD(P)-dependent dehydrogenase (short-subunit alcohol dehydrogenase family)